MGILRNNINILITISILYTFGLKNKKSWREKGEKEGTFHCYLSCGMMAQLSTCPVIITSEMEKNTVKMIGQSVCIACYTKGYYFSLHVYLPLEKF